MLNVTISNDIDTFNLRVDNITHSFVRFPTHAPLPADEDGNPQVFSLDLGMSLEQITLQGVVNTVSSEEGVDPSKAQLEIICRTWWAYGDEVDDLPTITLSAGESYRMHLKNADFRQVAALEDRWEFSIILLVRAKI